MRTLAPEVSFVETMRGTVETEGGQSSPIDLEAVASGESLRDFRRNGWVELRGLLRAPHWIDEAPVFGSLRITPRALVYQVRFRDRVGERFTLEGRKSPSVFTPLRSMTHMVAEVRDADAHVVARGAMRFDLRELPSFILSWLAWLPSSAHARRDVDVRRLACERRWLERFDRRVS